MYDSMCYSRKNASHTDDAMPVIDLAMNEEEPLLTEDDIAQELTNELGELRLPEEMDVADEVEL